MNKDKDIDLILEEDDDDSEAKRKFALWIHDSTIQDIKIFYKYDNCSSISAFIEKAIKFYIAHLSMDKTADIIPSVITNSLKDMVRENSNKQSRMMFKMAVELSIISNILASMKHLLPEDIDALRGYCVNEVKKINGALSFEDAIKWQD